MRIVSVRRSKVEMTIGVDLGDVWSHYCTLNEEGEVIDRGRFRTSPKDVEKWFIDVPPARVAMEAGTPAEPKTICTGLDGRNLTLFAEPRQSERRLVSVRNFAHQCYRPETPSRRIALVREALYLR
jgi:hypothetical protein